MKKFSHILILICWLAMQTLALACLNMYGTNIEGHAAHASNRLIADRLQRISANEAQWKLKEAELAKGLESADFKHRSDYAVALLHLGKVEQAIEILEQIEQEHPGEYIVAANLGTAYELNGENEQALEWIKKGMERNPASHNGSEWLHVKILETKLKLAEDPDWLKTHSVLGIEFGTDPKPLKPEIELVDGTGERRGAFEIIYALDYQLGERLQFVSPREPIVGDLLFDLANLIATADVIEHAIPVYELADQYGVRDPDLLNRRVANFQQLVAANQQAGKQMGGDLDLVSRIALVLILAIGGLGALVIVIALIVKCVRHRSRQSGTQS